MTQAHIDRDERLIDTEPETVGAESTGSENTRAENAGPENIVEQDAGDANVAQSAGAERGGKYAAHYEAPSGDADKGERDGFSPDRAQESASSYRSEDDAYGAVAPDEASSTASDAHDDDLSDSMAGSPAASVAVATDKDAPLVQDADELTSRWDTTQATFVDDPRAAVQQAGDLVEDVLDRLRTSFGDERGRLEELWESGAEPSTEDLRLAIQQYREFFRRLLAV